MCVCVVLRGTRVYRETDTIMHGIKSSSRSGLGKNDNFPTINSAHINRVNVSYIYYSDADYYILNLSLIHI